MEEVKKIGEVSRSFDSLCESIEALSHKVDSLKVRITPILSQSIATKNPNESKNLPTPYSTDIAVSMGVQRSKVEDILSIVNEMISKIEL